MFALKYDDEKDILYEDDVFYYPQESKHSLRGGCRSFEKAIQSLSSKSNKIKKTSRGKGEKTNKIGGALKAALSLMPGMKHKITDNLHHILETVHDSIPMAVNLVLPLALKNVLPGGLHRPATAAVSEHVVPVLQQKIYPALANRLIPENVRYEMAVRKSMRKLSSSESDGDE